MSPSPIINRVLGTGQVSAAAPAPFANAKSLLSDGVAEYLNVPASSAFALGTTGAISVWARWTVAMVNFQDLVACFFPTGNATGFTFWIIDRKPGLFISNGAAFNVATSTGSALSDDTWYHLVASWSGATLKIYVDGTQHGADLALTVGAGDSTVDLHIGADTNSVTSRFFPGNLDDISIWNAYLDASGVAALRSAGKPADLSTHPSVANQVAWWRMGDSPDTIAAIADRSGNGHTATPQNMEAGDIVSDVP